MLARCTTTPRRSALATSALQVLALLPLTLAAGALTACRDTPPSFNPPGTNDASVSPTLCTRREDCGGRGICVSGVCEAVTPCQTDDQCAMQNKVCHQSRGYCVQCDGRPNQCSGGETCQFDFTCVVLGARDGGTGDAAMCTGMCTDRTQCNTDQVCSAGSCCPPPSRCTSPEQCPASRPLCNGATGECFGGDSCSSDPDCASRSGCSGNRCFCDIPAGSAMGECRTRPDECMSDNDCRDMGGMYNGRFCTLSASPHICAPAPACTGDQDCAGAGLVCDQVAGSPSNGHCINGTPCPNGNECTANQVCVGAVCVSRNCINTPNFCPMGQVCNQQTGACGPAMGTTCQNDSVCPSGQYCDTSINRCAPGCRDANDCGGNLCNAQHRCEGGGGMLCATCASDADCPAGTSCHTNPFTQAMRCQEPCNAFTGQDCMIDTNATCLALWCGCGP